MIRCAEGVADALQAAHAQGVLHRDINPNNIMLTGDGRPLLLDFGLAQRIPRGSDSSAVLLTQTDLVAASNQAAGTPAYMPEQIVGQPLDGLSDLFCLVPVLYEMCTGRPAFEAPDRLALMKPSSINSRNLLPSRTPRFRRSSERIIREIALEAC